MSHGRLVGIDLGIASAHTVRVLDGEGTTITKRKACPPQNERRLDRRVRVTDRLTEQGAAHKRRINDLARQLMPMTPLTGDLRVADLAVLERYADPNALLWLGLKRLTALIANRTTMTRTFGTPRNKPSKT